MIAKNEYCDWYFNLIYCYTNQKHVDFNVNGLDFSWPWKLACAQSIVAGQYCNKKNAKFYLHAWICALAKILSSCLCGSNPTLSIVSPPQRAGVRNVLLLNEMWCKPSASEIWELLFVKLGLIANAIVSPILVFTFGLLGFFLCLYKVPASHSCSMFIWLNFPACSFTDHSKQLFDLLLAVFSHRHLSSFPELFVLVVLCVFFSYLVQFDFFFPILFLVVLTVFITLTLLLSNYHCVWVLPQNKC